MVGLLRRHRPNLPVLGIALEEKTHGTIVPFPGPARSVIVGREIHAIGVDVARHLMRAEDHPDFLDKSRRSGDRRSFEPGRRGRFEGPRDAVRSGAGLKRAVQAQIGAGQDERHERGKPMTNSTRVKPVRRGAGRGGLGARQSFQASLSAGGGRIAAPGSSAGRSPAPRRAGFQLL